MSLYFQKLNKTDTSNDNLKEFIDFLSTSYEKYEEKVQKMVEIFKAIVNQFNVLFNKYSHATINLFFLSTTSEINKFDIEKEPIRENCFSEICYHLTRIQNGLASNIDWNLLKTQNGNLN